MNLAFGSAGVMLAFVGSIGAIVTLIRGLRTGQARLLALARPYSLLVAGGAIVATVAMQRALIDRDFTILYVAENGSSRTPALFNIATMWSALEGSILLWGLILAAYVALVVHRFRDRLSDPLVAWALVTMFVVTAFFFALMIGPSNPFLSFDPPIGYDGPGPNPLLQNHLLVTAHPPLLYLGYVGFTVPFSFAIAALITGRVGEGWLIETRRWTLYAWGFLTAGIVLGAWWSYEVLGWGGYWAWDPVENVSFLPWLTGTAYIHSVMVQERRGMLRVWNLSLLCATFALTIFATFITRSGVLASVHAFGNGEVGPPLLGFFVLILVVSVGLIGWRGDRLWSVGRIDSPVSREGAFLINNVLFGAFAFVVLLGTVFPLVAEALWNQRISVGEPYFERMTMPVGFALLFMMAVAPVLPWRKASGELLAQRLHWPAWIGVVSLAAALVSGIRGLAPLLAFALGGFAGGAALRQLTLATRRQGWRGIVGRTNGGMIVHIGVVCIGIAFAASSTGVRDSEFRLAPGDTATISGHTITYLGSETVETAARTDLIARVQVDDGPIRTPAISRYLARGQIVGAPSVQSSLVEDVYLTLLVAPNDDDIAVIRVIVQPLVAWLWLGGTIMVIGTVLSAVPGSRRHPTNPVAVLGGGTEPDKGTEPDDDTATDGSSPPSPAEPVRAGTQ